ncbi:MAG: insulinase family protein [Bacteroidia bacterium]|nr:insulinase family protein [Bacteroidia bacterium]
MEAKKITLICLLLYTCVLSFAETSDALKVKTFTLSNGMEVWINEDHSQPKAFGAVVVRAGAKDCPGTGIAHYFEHIMFKGTEKIGTTDYAAEKPYLDSIADLYDQLAVAETDSVRAVIQMEINRLNIAASDYAIPNEFNNLISACGGSNLNAYTSQDITVYHNQFLPSFFEQWAELNSERLIDPVFRLFQSELETVYEEKNRAESNELSAFSMMISSEGFKGTPYEYPVIGTTANLKNPQLSHMKAFFDKYYVASNMGLMLTGDVDAERAIPILEKTFGRIRSGNIDKPASAMKIQYAGKKEVEALAKIPMIKLRALCYRGPSKKDEDCLPLSLLAFMLNNSEGIGLLDELTTGRKLMGAICMYPDLAFEDAAIFPILIMPKLLFQSNKRAESMVVKVLDRVKKGDFSDEYFESCKQTFKRHLITKTEGISGRMNEMVNAFAEGKDWESVLSAPDRIDALSKDDIIALANKYIGEDYLCITKKFGNPEKDDLQKPLYKKVSPKNNGVSSKYADAIKITASQVQLPRVSLDYESAADIKQISGNVKLYTVANELNDVFNLKISYPVGTAECPASERVVEYLNLLGTKSMTYDEHRSRLQSLGGSVGFSVDRQGLNVIVSGFDGNFEETLSLVADLMDKPNSDKEKVAIIKENDLANQILAKRDIGEIMSALFQKIAYGEDSYYLKDKGKISDKVLMETWDHIQSMELDIHYSGSIPTDSLANIIRGYEFINKASQAHPYYIDRRVALNGEPGVYFVNKSRATQSRIYALVLGDKIEDTKGRFSSYAFADYMGGGMGSVLFQEIREFRSMAYSTGAAVYKPEYCHKSIDPTYFYAYVSTQSDKTIDAMTVVDSLIRNVPLSESRAKMTVSNLWFERVNSYPDFRRTSTTIANGKREGWSSDPADYLYDLLEYYSIADVEQYWKDNISGHNIVWAVVGDNKKIDMEALSKFGPVYILTAKNIFNN